MAAKRSQRWQDQNIAIRAIGIGDRASGQKFCDYTQFPANWLYVDPQAELHDKLGLYRGLSLKIPGFSSGANAWLNLMLMCAGMGQRGRTFLYSRQRELLYDH